MQACFIVFGISPKSTKMNYFFPTEDHNHEYGVVETFISDPNDDPKNIVISFDGTGGNPGWAVQRGNEDR